MRKNNIRTIRLSERTLSLVAQLLREHIEDNLAEISRSITSTARRKQLEQNNMTTIKALSEVAANEKY